MDRNLSKSYCIDISFQWPSVRKSKNRSLIDWRTYMPTYNKLVRDRIPEIIQSNGNKINTRILDEDEYKEELQLKLNEELQEYLEAMEDSHAVEELADMLELIYSLVEVHNSSFDELEEVRKEKRQVRGGFNERVYLIDVDD